MHQGNEFGYVQMGGQDGGMQPQQQQQQQPPPQQQQQHPGGEQHGGQTRPPAGQRFDTQKNAGKLFLGGLSLETTREGLTAYASQW